MDDRLITIAKYSYSRAEIVKSMLESEGIECSITNVNVLQPHIGSGVKVAVMQKDIEKALKILIEIEKKYEQARIEEEKDSIVTIGAYSYTRAQIVKTKLELEKIECFLKNVNMIQPSVGSGVKVRIHEKDIEKALPIIIKINKEFELNTDVEEDFQVLQEINKILLPVDFSEFSIRAAKYAVKIAAKYNAEIHLFHAYYNPAVYAEPFAEGYAYNLNVHKYIRDLEIEADRNLQAFKEDMLNSITNGDEIDIHTTLVSGFVDAEIANMSKIYKPDLVIIGMKGETRSSESVLGINAKKILRNATTPVLLIPEKAKHKEIDEIENIMYATELDKTDFVTIRKLIGIVGKIDPQIFCTHISSGKDDKWNKPKLDRLNEYIRNRYPDYKVDCLLLQNEDKVKAVEDFVVDKNIGLIAINAYKGNLISRLFGKSFAEEMVFHSEVPLLIFQA